jgi:hypothetical protein
LAAPLSAEAAAFAGASKHLGSVAYAVPKVSVATIALAVGEDPVVTLR